MDTIFALATARGVAGVAVVRISGAGASEVADSLCGNLPSNRGVRRITNRDGVLLDSALVIVFQGSSSFTGEPVVEFHLHGSPAVIAAVLNELSNCDGARLAEAGEFTRRALENGKLDLAEVEGLADLIEAETEAQRRQAIRVFDGALGDKSEEWRTSLIRAASLIEATIDFADEDVPVDVLPEVGEILDRVKLAMKGEADGVRIAERIRDGFEVAIVGKPNVGKSTLLNRLAGRDAAITSNVAGTTRDVIEVKMDINGLPVTLIDTAGIRESDDIVENLGVQLAIQRASHADIRVLLKENNELPNIELQPDDIVLNAKADLTNVREMAISGETGEGVELLIGLISEKLDKRAARIGVAMRERHRVAIISCLDALDRTSEHISEAIGLDLVADELHSAIRLVDSIVGRVDVEDLLDEIFASFCIGK